jgi:hypothetical protein
MVFICSNMSRGKPNIQVPVKGEIFCVLATKYEFITNMLIANRRGNHY